MCDDLRCILILDAGLCAFCFVFGGGSGGRGVFVYGDVCALCLTVRHPIE
jgi:hypothetical protein